jgi:hypothetical protein
MKNVFDNIYDPNKFSFNILKNINHSQLIKINRYVWQLTWNVIWNNIGNSISLNNKYFNNNALQQYKDNL